MRLMGIDFGDARVGIALSDPLCIMSQGYKTIKNDGTDALFLEIQEILKYAKVIRGGKKQKVDLGAAVTITMDGKKVEYSIVGPTEANPLEGKISNESPIGKAMLGRKAGETFEFNGKKVKIVEIK